MRIVLILVLLLKATPFFERSTLAETPPEPTKLVASRIAQYKVSGDPTDLAAALQLAQLPERPAEPDWLDRRAEKLHALLDVYKVIGSAADPNFNEKENPRYDTPTREKIAKLRAAKDPAYEPLAQDFKTRMERFRARKSLSLLRSQGAEIIGNFIWRSYPAPQRESAMVTVKEALRNQRLFDEIKAQVKPY